VTWEQEKGSREVVDVIQTVQCSTSCSSCGSLVKDVCLATAHGRVVLKQRPPGLGRNGDQIEEMVETEKGLYKKAKSGEEVRIAMGPLRGVCQTKKSLVSVVPSDPLKCAVVFNVLCKRKLCVVETYPVRPMWSRNLNPSTQGTRPPHLICLATGELVY
jgi:hypothetical protein